MRTHRIVSSGASLLPDLMRKTDAGWRAADDRRTNRSNLHVSATHVKPWLRYRMLGPKTVIRKHGEDRPGIRNWVPGIVGKKSTEKTARVTK